MESHRLREPDSEWFVLVAWLKGTAENSRTADGGVSWAYEPDPGWCVELGCYPPGRVPKGEGEELLPGIRLLVQKREPPFPGGRVDEENGRLRLRVDNAA